MPRPTARRYGSPQMTRPKAEHALAQLLLNARDERLAEFTADHLVRLFKVSIAFAAKALADERQRREAA